MVNIIQPDPRGKVWLVSIKKTLHFIQDARRHIPEPAMVNPMPGGIDSEWKVLDAVLVDAVI